MKKTNLKVKLEQVAFIRNIMDAACITNASHVRAARAISKTVNDEFESKKPQMEEITKEYHIEKKDPEGNVLKDPDGNPITYPDPNKMGVINERLGLIDCKVSFCPEEMTLLKVIVKQYPSTAIDPMTGKQGLVGARAVEAYADLCEVLWIKLDEETQQQEEG